MADSGGRPAAWRSDRPTIRWGAYAWALVGLALAFALAWRGLGYVRIVVVPLSLALFPAAILTPPAQWLEDRGVPAALAAFVVLLGFLAVLGGIVWVMVVQIQSQLTGLVDQFESTYEQLQQRFNTLPFLPEPNALFGGGSGGGSAATDAALRAATATVRFFTELFIFLVASFFYIKDRRRITAFLRRLFPPPRRDDAEAVGDRVWDTVSAYIRGQTIIATIDGVLVAIGLLIAGIPLAVVLGAVVFFGAFIPTVGSIAAGAVAVAVALLAEGFVAALITLAIIVGVQQFEGNVLAPYILGREVEVHPLVILAVITAGAVLLGPWGAIIAVPLAASVYRTADYVRGHQQTPE